MNLLDALSIALYAQIPVVIGGVLHMWAVTHDQLPGWKIPINRRLFGANKTWRGLLLMPAFTALGALCLLPMESYLGERAPFGPVLPLVGAWVGLAYVLTELPNSWLKRCLGAAPGALPSRHTGSCCSISSIRASASPWPTACIRDSIGRCACCSP